MSFGGRPVGCRLMTGASDSPKTYSMTTQWSPRGVGAEVVEVDEVGVLEVEALGDAAQFGVGVAAEELERDFLAAVADGEVDLAERRPGRRRA